MPSVIDVAEEAKAKDRKRNDDALWVLLLLSLHDGDPQKVWQQLTPSAFGGLLTLNGFTWNPQTQTYRSNSGTNVNGTAVQRLIVNAGHAAEIEIETSLQDAIHTGELAKWRADSMDQLVGLYAASAAAGAGGFNNLNEAQLQDVIGSTDQGLTGAATSLSDIVSGLSSGDVTQPQAVSRAGMNAAVAHSIYQAVRRSSHRSARDNAGNLIFLQERNVLTQLAQHCGECPALSDLGNQPIGSLPLPGQRECGPMCRCHLAYFAADAA